MSTENDLTTSSSSSTTTTFRRRVVNETSTLKTHISNANTDRYASRSMADTRPDHPIHMAQDSLLSASSGYTNYRGFFNLALILLVLSNARVALENAIKYGILIDYAHWFQYSMRDPRQSPAVVLMVTVNLFLFVALSIEKLLAAGRIPERISVVFHFLNLTAVLIWPMAVILRTESNPVGAAFALCFYSVVFLKLVSYAHVNYWCRLHRLNSANGTPADNRQQFNGRKFVNEDDRLHYVSRSRSFSADPSLTVYPANLTVSNLYYYIMAPTLCYELNFPRSPRIRKWFVLKRLLESFVLLQVIIALSQQWMVPLVKNSLEPFIAMNYARMLERLLKLAIPNHVVWLLSFYWMFHSLFNLTAELLRFADREFYRDWWNAESVGYFWRNWNIPVHHWCVRHLYKPMVNAGFRRNTASIAVFFVSAFFHEYLISVPLHMFRLWAFTGMLAQIPLDALTSRFAKGRLGNVVVWLSLIVGQPLCVLMYVHDWYVTHHLQTSVQPLTL